MDDLITQLLDPHYETRLSVEDAMSHACFDKIPRQRCATQREKKQQRAAVLKAALSHIDEAQWAQICQSRIGPNLSVGTNLSESDISQDEFAEAVARKITRCGLCSNCFSKATGCSTLQRRKSSLTMREEDAEFFDLKELVKSAQAEVSRQVNGSYATLANIHEIVDSQLQEIVRFFEDEFTLEHVASKI